MLIDRTERGIGFLLSDVSHLLRKVIDRRLQPQGLTRAQWAVLASLADRDGITQSDLAEGLEIERSTAGRLIDHMVASGWVERRPIPGDRRSWGIHLRPGARPLIAKGEHIIREIREAALQGLGSEEQRRLAAAVETIKTNLRTLLDGER
ncbi:MAG: MarR family winged helix-turn-helix transcriptional regulator [Rhodospirillales bacterium]